LGGGHGPIASLSLVTAEQNGVLARKCKKMSKKEYYGRTQPSKWSQIVKILQKRNAPHRRELATVTYINLLRKCRCCCAIIQCRIVVCTGAIKMAVCQNTEASFSGIRIATMDKKLS
jgi:hypothetical protein